MKAVIRIIQALLTAVWLALLAVSVLLFISARDGGLAGISDWRGYIVTDGSMAPELKEGDLAVIHMGAVPKAGDAVLSKDSSDSLELTRIIGTSEGQLILKPDGLEESRLAGAEELEGVYAGYVPGFGEPFRFLCGIPGIITVFAAGIMLIVLPGFMLRAPRAAKTPRRPEPRLQRSKQEGYTPRH
ncbi:S24/S26 family peptidase [Acutalibacter muris]|uniref:S24/S26 family peptidase n=1 Tax=Acutalibacter muris TaxID=1796620 RepID=UPI001C3E977C|nr:S24/S26 family peptidase [Acutalibacter muris]MCI9193064.1 hypothetical protein [Acutalibacter muris]